MTTASEQMARYAACVYESDDWVEIRALKSGTARKVWCRAKDLLTHVPELDALNGDGWNIYAGPNPRKNDGLSGDENVAIYRTLFVDFDGIKADGVGPGEIALTRIDETGLPAPTLVLFSGHGIHTYWKLAEPIEEKRWRNLQERLIAVLGSDPTIKNPERIMRLPGFTNHKPPVVEAFITEADPGLIYAAEAIDGSLPVPAVKATASPITLKASSGEKTVKARATLYAAKWRPCSEGERNSQAYLHAAQLRRDFDLSEADAWEILTDWNATNSSPLDERELRSAFDDAAKYAKGAVGSKLDQPKRGKRLSKGNAQDADEPTEPPVLRVRCFADVRPTQPSFLWSNRIVDHAFNTLNGDPGQCKSFLSVKIAAHISCGLPFPDCPDIPVKKGVALFYNQEDDGGITRTRLDAAGADVRNVLICDGVQTGADRRQLDINYHRDALERFLDDVPECKLIVFDPITACLGTTNQNSTTEVRSALDPLAELAARREVTILGVNHLNKRADLSFIYRSLGSQGFTAAARSAWAVIADKDDPETHILAPIKTNYSIKPTGLKYRIIDGAVQFLPDVWTGQLDEQARPHEGKLKVEQCADWLQNRLRDGSALSTTIFDEAKGAGFSRDLCYRAKEKLGVQAAKAGFNDGRWYWTLPVEDTKIW